MSAMRTSTSWVWVVAVVVALVAVAACFGPQASNDYFERGVARLKEGKYKGAIADLDQAIQLPPHDTSAYYHRCLVKSSLGQFQEALTDLQTALELANEVNGTDSIVSLERKIQELKQHK